MRERNIRVLDLFAGAGGLSAGLASSSKRFRTVAAVESDLAAAASYEATFGEGTVFAGTIEAWLDQADAPEDIDVVVGGPPCQGFSTLGKQRVEDVRNALWEQYAETIRRVRPKYFVVENVAVFAKSVQFAQFKKATASGFLRDYTFEHRVLNAAEYGAAQSRKRAVLIGHHRDLPFPGFPEPRAGQTPVTVADALHGVPTEVDSVDLPPGRFVTYRGKTFPGAFSVADLHVGRTYTDLSQARFRAIPPGGNRFDLPLELQARCWRTHTSGSVDVMGRLHWDRPSVTIRTEFFKPEKGRYLHPEAMRAISHHEAALLQGFSTSHRFVGSKVSIARQIGNAVPIPLGAAIGRQLANAL